MLVTDNLRLVYWYVGKVAQKTYPGETFDDLVSDGTRGLIQAARGFDALRGFKFSTYAVNWIKGAIQADVATRQGRSKHANLKGVGKRIPLSQQVSLDAPLSEDGGSLADVIPDRGLAAHNYEAQALVRQALDALPDELRHVLPYLTGQASAREVSESVGVSHNTIRNRAEEATCIMRRALERAPTKPPLPEPVERLSLGVAGLPDYVLERLARPLMKRRAGSLGVEFWTESRERQLWELRDAKATWDQIAAYFGLSAGSCRDRYFSMKARAKKAASG